MTKFALTAVAAALLTPALIASASAQSVSIRVGDPGYRAYSQERVVVRSSGPRVVVRDRDCKRITVRTKRSDGSVVIRKIRKCG